MTDEKALTSKQIDPDEVIERLRFVQDRGGGFSELAGDCISLIQGLNPSAPAHDSHATAEEVRACLICTPSAPETTVRPVHPTIDEAWSEFLKNTASDRSTWEAFQYAWLTRGDLNPDWQQLEAQCQNLWRTNVTLVCHLAKGHSGDHKSGRFNWTAVEPSVVETGTGCHHLPGQAEWCSKCNPEKAAQAVARSEKASAEPPLCDCDPDFGCKECDPKLYRCCQAEMERRAASQNGSDNSKGDN